jgi:hypothetical protein
MTTRLIVDCITGETIEVPLTDEEEADLEAQRADAAAVVAEAEAAHAALAAQVAAHEDPVVQALAKMLGL